MICFFVGTLQPRLPYNHAKAFERSSKFSRKLEQSVGILPYVLIIGLANAGGDGNSKQVEQLKKLGARITLDDQNRVIGVNLGERKVTMPT